MKLTTKIFACLVAAVTICSTTYASPRAAEASGADYLVAAEDLDGLHIGSFYRYSSRELNDGYNTLSQDNIAFMVGYDVLRWASLYAFVGMGDAQLDINDFGDHGFSAIYGFGGWVSILDHDLISALSCESRIRLSATAQYMMGSPEINGVDSDFSEFYGAVTLGIVNEVLGKKDLWPDAIGLFVGPVWSVFDCDDYEATGSEAGIAFGLDVYVTRRVGISLSYETYGSEDNAVNFSLNCRF